MIWAGYPTIVLTWEDAMRGAPYRDSPFEYKKGETWDRLVHQGVHLLQRFAQDDRVHVRNACARREFERTE